MPLKAVCRRPWPAPSSRWDWSPGHVEVQLEVEQDAVRLPLAPDPDGSPSMQTVREGCRAGRALQQFRLGASWCTGDWSVTAHTGDLDRLRALYDVVRVSE